MRENKNILISWSQPHHNILKFSHFPSPSYIFNPSKYPLGVPTFIFLLTPNYSFFPKYEARASGVLMFSFDLLRYTFSSAIRVSYAQKYSMDIPTPILLINFSYFQIFHSCLNFLQQMFIDMKSFVFAKYFYIYEFYRWLKLFNVLCLLAEPYNQILEAMYRDSQKKRIHEVEDFSKLIDKHPGNDFFKKTILSLKSSFPTFRRVYGEGNCFYRTFAYLYLVNTAFNSFQQLFPSVKFTCRGVPDVDSDRIFQQRLRYYWQEKLRPLSHCREQEKADRIMDIFNQVYCFDEVMIGYFRSKNYEIMLRKRRQFELYAMEFEYEHLLNQVQTFYAFSQLVEIYALPEAFNINIVIINLNENQDGVDIISAGKEPEYCTKYYLLRTLNPEHFEVVYPVLRQQESKGQKINEWLLNVKTSVNSQINRLVNTSPRKQQNRNFSTNYKIETVPLLSQTRVQEKPQSYNNFSNQNNKKVATTDVGNKNERAVNPPLKPITVPKQQSHQNVFNNKYAKKQAKEVVLGEQNTALKAVKQVALLVTMGAIIFLPYWYLS